jgi:hypothetical protein
MEFEWLPKELVTRCNALVAAYHKARGGSLPKILWHRDTMVFIAIHVDLRSFLNAANAAWKFSIAGGIGAIVALVLAAVWNWWIALAIIPTTFVMIYFKRREVEFYMLAAAIILAIEMMGDDFAGWGTRYPEAMMEANKLLRDGLPNDRTRLLDLYLPNRADFDSALLEEFGPNE